MRDARAGALHHRSAKIALPLGAHAGYYKQQQTRDWLRARSTTRTEHQQSHVALNMCGEQDMTGLLTPLCASTLILRTWSALPRPPLCPARHTNRQRVPEARLSIPRHARAAEAQENTVF